MKVTLNLTKLLKEKEITKEDYNRFVALAKKDTNSHAFSMLIVFACIAIAVGFVGVNADLFFRIIKLIHDAIGGQGLKLLGTALLLFIGSKTNSGFLIGLSPFMILSLLGGSTFYRHASYFIAIKEPAISIVVFSILALIGLFVSKKVEFDKERLALIFSRVCLIIVNLGFWIGSLWGSKIGSTGNKISDTILTVLWAIALLLCGAWGAKEGRKFVVNTCAVFGSIHFYTQWFERLGASPGSLMAAGVIALLLIYGLRSYNQKTT